MDTVVLVAVDNAAFKFDKLYSYLMPEDLRRYAAVGARVLVPFGKGLPRMGVVLGTERRDRDEALKTVIDIERDTPLLDDEMVKLILLLRETTFCTYYDAVKAVLPKNSRLVPDAGSLSMAPAAEGHLETAFRYIPQDPPPRLTKKQQIVCGLITDSAMTAAEITEKTGVTRAVVDRLAEKSIVQRLRRAREIELYAPDGAAREIPALTPPQQAAYDQITACMDDPEKPDTTLLHGVTSSGKTILYIKLIERTALAGKGAMILVPEIALATQMIYRLREMFGVRVAILHSALSDSERQLQWDKIREGACDIVVGTRSAVFAPLRAPGLLIIDEEQEGSYISEQTPRYAAAKVAAYRAKYHGAHLLLASATPSVESYFNAQSGRYNLVGLDERYGDMPLPDVRVVDMRRELLAGNSHHVSAYLKEEIDARLERGEQCILLLNRRGYRTVSMCRSCREIVKCASCDTPLVVHKNRGRYVCHYCARSYPIEETCAKCGGAVMHTGIGTQKIEEDLEALFPRARILRLDLDTASRKNVVEKLLIDFSRGEYDIIIGTQMVAKGLDFKNVTLVGVLSIDQLLLMPSFRATERTFSMLTQVVGRSGRGDKKGEAIIQTIDPDNPVIRLAARQDYAGFYKDEIISRKTHLYPPFCALTTVGVIAESEEHAQKAASAFADILISAQTTRYFDIPLRILGPAPMRVAYINDLYRYQLVLKHREGSRFRAYLRQCMTQWNAGSYGGKARLYVDMAGGPDS